MWKDGIDLTEFGKVFLTRNVLDAINIFLCNSQSRNTVSKSSLSQVISSRVERTSQGSMLKMIHFYRLTYKT